MKRRHGAGAMPEGHDAIRVHVDADEPPALVFNERAAPGALVSWAWCQLDALDSLLRVMSESGRGGDADVEVVAAVRSVLGPAINALVFSELRAYQLRPVEPTPARRRRGKRRRKAADA